MATAAIPHFDIPFRYNKGTPAVVEQDSVAEVANCVLAICSTEPGQFFDSPDFGLRDMTFSQQPIKREEMLQAIQQWEPRAITSIDSFISAIDEAIAEANIEVEVSG